MQFNERRRQQFLGERVYHDQLIFLDKVIHGQRENLLKPEGKERGWHCSLLQGIGNELTLKLILRYTAGEPIELLRTELEQVITAYERYGELLWKYRQDRNQPVFDFNFLDEYCELMQLIGLCFLLHRRDLLPRIAALQDGEQGADGGIDTVYEEFMAYGLGADKRFETDQLCHMRPYENLFYGLTETTPEKALKEIDLCLKHWYKDLAGVGWHDSHKPDEDGNQGGYYGYWSFEAGAAVLLTGIEDDSSLHKYLYYPKDMVAWSRQHAANAAAGDLNNAEATRLRCAAGQPCPRSGYWSTAAKAGSRRYFKQGEVLPKIEGSDYGDTFWSWDIDQTDPSLLR